MKASTASSNAKVPSRAPVADMGRPDPDYFVIFAAMRSGSNLLEKSLAQYPGIEAHGELFNPSFIGKAGVESYAGISLEDREKDPARLIAAICDRSKKKIPGFRIFDGHDLRIEKKCLGDPACAKVILKRNPVDSYVSLKTARATNQWMLKNVAKRKTALVTFDTDEFVRYYEERQAFYDRLRQHIQTSGQSAFYLRYEDLHDRAVVDGVAQYLGASGERQDAIVPIRRQNPETLSDRVANFDEMREVLDAMGLVADVLPFDSEARRGPSVGQMVACRTAPVLLAVIPGCTSPHVVNWMQTVDQKQGNSASDLLRPKNQKDLNRWLADQSGTVCLSVVRNPLERAYDVFTARIVAGGYPAIRRRLERHFNLKVPNIDLSQAPRKKLIDLGYGVAQQREAFAVFLEFVRANLAGQTGVRMDAEWRSQASHLEGFSLAIPVSQIVREENVVAELAHLAKRMSLPIPSVENAKSKAAGVYRLAEIYDKEIEKLARKAYAKDYLKLGFEDWAPEGNSG